MAGGGPRRGGRGGRMFLAACAAVALVVWGSLFYKVVFDGQQLLGSTPTEECSKSRDTEECRQKASEGMCVGADAARMRRMCRWSCGLCVSQGGPTLPPMGPVQKTTAANLASLFRGDVDLAYLKKGGRDSVDLQDFVPGLWKKASYSKMCADPLGSRGNDILAKIEHKSSSAGGDQPTVLCMVYTMKTNHKSRVDAQRKTWGPMCDGFVAMSTVSDPNIPSLEVAHEGPEEWDNMWQKARSIWAWAGHTQLANYDYFLIGGDDMYVDVPNLKAYLATLNYTKPNYVGRKLHDPHGKIDFNAGGSGYLLNQAALKILYANLDNPSCDPHGKMFWEDVMVARCLRNHGVPPLDTRDDAKAERFHPVSPDQLLHVSPSNWLATYSTDFIHGVGGVSSTSISFHYLSAEAMRGIHTKLNKCSK